MVDDILDLVRIRKSFDSIVKQHDRYYVYIVVLYPGLSHVISNKVEIFLLSSWDLHEPRAVL